MDEANPLTKLPAALHEELEEPCPAEVTEAALQVWAERRATPSPDLGHQHSSRRLPQTGLMVLIATPGATGAADIQILIYPAGATNLVHGMIAQAHRIIDRHWKDQPERLDDQGATHRDHLRDLILYIDVALARELGGEPPWRRRTRL
ncbi:hypothetical protein ACQP1V_23685 [Microtetraspora malaysiensis]|uniref:hypothetical protein n=1 Tax=Microtetraspora malaysiensis TaxID=161358 RepID=UPI003D9107FE